MRESIVNNVFKGLFHGIVINLALWAPWFMPAFFIAYLAPYINFEYYFSFHSFQVAFLFIFIGAIFFIPLVIAIKYMED